jgi:integrase
MDEWGWEQLQRWLNARLELPVERCSASSTARPEGDRGRAPPSAPSSAGSPLRAGVRRRFAPHQLRHAHALELAREGVPLNIIQRQLGHSNLGTLSIYLLGIDPEEIIATVHTRRAPIMSASAGLRL